MSASVQEAIRRLRIETTTSGVTEATNQLKNLASAQDGVAVAAERVERATLSEERRFDSIERKYVAQVRARQDYEKIQRQINDAVSQNPALQDRANIVLAAAAEKFAIMTGAANDNAAALKRQADAAAQVASVGARVNSITGVTGGSDTAARAADVAAYGRQLDDLRAKYNPLFAAGRNYRDALLDINNAAKVGAISDAERLAALQRTKDAFAQQITALRSGTQATNENANAMHGLSLQTKQTLIQLPDIIQGIGGGQSLLQVGLQQGGQLVQLYGMSPQGVGGSLRQVGSEFGTVAKSALSFLTVGRLVFGGVATAVTAAGFALSSYLDTQREVSRSLTGIGRASGSTVAGINAMADQGSALTGLSVTEARALAAALAATGRVANDNILPIVKMGKDIATAFGVDAAEATKMLAQAFADPAKGAEALNARLGFLDAATQRNIQSLTEQNRLYEAQRVLAAAVQSGLQGVNESVGTSTKFWTGLGNAISNAWDKFGAWASRATGIGLNIGLDDQLAAAQQKLASLEKQAGQLEEINKRAAFAYGASGPNAATSASGANSKQIAETRAEVDRLTEALKRNAEQAQAARDAQASFAQDAAIRAQLPEIDQMKQLRTQQELLVRTMVAVQTTGGESSPILAATGRSYEQLAQALSVATEKLKSFKNEFSTSMEALKLQNDAMSAFSPGAQAEIARRMSLQSTSKSDYTDVQRQQLAEQAYANALKQSTIALSEQQRARQLTATQAVQSAQLEMDMVGKSIGQQAEARVNLRARETLPSPAPQAALLPRTGANDNATREEKAA